LTDRSWYTDVDILHIISSFTWLPFRRWNHLGKKRHKSNNQVANIKQLYPQSAMMFWVISLPSLLEMKLIKNDISATVSNKKLMYQ
jgi:hypothetical protein